MTSKSRRDDFVPPRRQRKGPRRGWKPIVIGASAAAVLLVVIALIWTAVHFSKSRRGDPRLIGTWQSDADATIMELRKARPVSDKQEVAMRELFGKMKVTYTDATITTELNGVVDTQPYQVRRRFLTIMLDPPVRLFAKEIQS